jgi:hypothetical protein
MAGNPFTPTFGIEPRFLADRERIVDDFSYGLENGPGDPNRSTILIGPRGSGKTVLLSKLAHEAQQRGWIYAFVNAADGMLNSLLEQAHASGAEYLKRKKQTRISGVTAGGFGVTTSAVDSASPSWRMEMSDLMDELARFQVGLLLIVDEVDVGKPEMVSLVSDFQHFIREGREVALLMAGLPGKVLQLFQHDSISFIRRSFQHRLSAVPIPAAQVAIERTVSSEGRTITPDALALAAANSGGFPFLIQLIGYHMWHLAGELIEVEDVSQGTLLASADMERMILETTVSELSRRDIDFLLAMAQDDRFSYLKDVAKRMGYSSAAAGQYRLRLLQQGLISNAGYGRVAFELPLLREYLLEHYAQQT